MFLSILIFFLLFVSGLTIKIIFLNVSASVVFAPKLGEWKYSAPFYKNKSCTIQPEAFETTPNDPKTADDYIRANSSKYISITKTKVGDQSGILGLRNKNTTFVNIFSIQGKSFESRYYLLCDSSTEYGVAHNELMGFIKNSKLPTLKAMAENVYSSSYGTTAPASTSAGTTPTATSATPASSPAATTGTSGSSSSKASDWTNGALDAIPAGNGATSIGVAIPNTKQPANGMYQFKDYVSAIYEFSLKLGAVLAVLMIVYAGYKYINSAGDTTKLGEAKEVLTGAISGFAILLIIGLLLRYLVG